MGAYHEPVLREEAAGLLVTDRDGVYVDGTIGGGGHAERICGLLDAHGRLIGIDADADAIDASRARLERFRERVTLVRGNFRDIVAELHARGVSRVAGILLDLGVSSHQLDEESRGFSFRPGAVLDMRMDTRARLTAHDVVNGYPEERLEALIREFGEEHAARRIARAIVRARPLGAAADLNRVIERCTGGRFLMKSLARVYQAIRIEVNGELESLRGALEAAPDLLSSGGRCVIIAYHSLEDRTVKEFFRVEAAQTVPSRHRLIPDRPKIARLRVLTKKPVRASAEEILHNPRARSARLRAAERL